MTVTDQDPTELLVGLRAPLPPGSGPDLDAVVAGGRRRRRRSRAVGVAGVACVVGVLGVSGAALTPVLTGDRGPSSPPAAAELTASAGGRTSWVAVAAAPGPIGAVAQAQVDAVLRGAGSTDGSPLGPVRWSAAYDTAPPVRDGEALAAPSSSGGTVGYRVDEDPVTGADGHLDTSATTQDWSSASSTIDGGGSEVAGVEVPAGDVVWSSSGFADGSETSTGSGTGEGSRDLVTGLLRDGVLYEVAWSGSPRGGSGQPPAAVLREAVERIADAVTAAGLVTGADPGLTDGSAARAAEQAERTEVAAAVEAALRGRIEDAVRAAGVGGGASWDAPSTGSGTSTWTDGSGATTSAISGSGRAAWGGGAVEVAYALAPEGPGAEVVGAGDACELDLLPDIAGATCRVLAPEGDEVAVALATSERVLADRGGLVVPIHRIAVSRGGQQLLLEVTGTGPVLDDAQLLSLARSLGADLAAANEEAAGLPGS